MSVLSENIKAALYAKLNVSGVTSLATDGVFYGEATKNGNYKALIFEKVSNVPAYAFGFTLKVEDSLWNLKTFAENIREGEAIINAAVTALGQSLTLSSGRCLGVMRLADLPEIKQPLSDRNIFMVGVTVRIWAEN